MVHKLVQVPFPSITVCNLNRIDCRRYRDFILATNCTAATNVTACESSNLAKHGAKDLMAMTEELREVVNCDAKPGAGAAENSEVEVRQHVWVSGFCEFRFDSDP